MRQLRIKGVPDPFDTSIIEPIEQDNIEATGGSVGERGKIMLRSLDDALLFFRVDTCPGAPEALMLAQSHFYKYQVVAILHDEIYFAHTTTKVARQ